MKLLRFYQGHVFAWVVCVTLLIVQANLTLSLPTYMSDIVDVGLQQGGIESPTPETVSADALDDLSMFMSDNDWKTVDAAYSAPDAEGIRTYTGTDEEAASDGAVGSALGLPECVVLALEQGISTDQMDTDLLGSGAQAAPAAGAAQAANPQAAAAAQADPKQLAAMEAMQKAQKDGKITLDTVRALYDAGLVTRDQLVESADNMADAMGSTGGTIIDQRAVDYVKQEYEAQGIDLDQVRSDYLNHIAFIMFLICAGTLVTTVVDGLVASRAAAAIARDTRSRLFKKVMRLSPAEVNQFSQASLITRCTNDVTQVQQICVMSMRMVMLAPIMGIVAFIRVTATRTGLEWIIGVAILVICAVMGLLLGFTLPKFQRMQSLVDRVNLVAREMLDGIMPIRAFGREDYEKGRFKQANTELMDTQLFVNRAMSFAMPAITLVMNLIVASIVWFGASGIENGNLQVGTMMAFITYTMQIVMAFMILAMVSVMLPRAMVSAERISDVLDCKVSITDPEDPKTPAPGVHGELAFDDVTFTYPDATDPVVEGVSFTTTPGKRVAIIGSTGSGKSTLVQLIPRLYDATKGAVTLDGVNVKDMALQDLRSRVGYVPQQGLLFSGTVEENIKFASANISDQAMEKAAGAAQAADFIAEKDGGYQGAIAQKGSNVSGGQRQRLSIARALAKDPEVLVFDDSFSALDYKTDAALRAALKHDYPECAVVVVAQRVATIMDADEILVLDQGHVAGQGTHEELLRSCPTYLEIATSQLSAQELGLTEEDVDRMLGRPARKLDEAIDSEVALLEDGFAANGSRTKGGER